MTDGSPTGNLGMKILMVIGAIVVAWIALNLVTGALRWVFSIFGYVIVAALAFWLGRVTAGPTD